MAKKKDYTRREVIGTLGAALATSAVVTLPTEAKGKESSQQVRRWLVVRYRVAWHHPRNTGLVTLYLQSTSTPVNLNVASLEHFSGYLAILKETPVYYDSRGWLFTGAEEIG
jgi:DMSO/TMAO reductase YedYZ molybdopterin-dependent catalytic subunit